VKEAVDANMARMVKPAAKLHGVGTEKRFLLYEWEEGAPALRRMGCAGLAPVGA